MIPRIREAVPHAELTVLSGPPAVGHFPQVEAPEVVGPLLTEWLADSL
ncbi:alpha/beta fold hydrolase [Streptomyces sp. NBC_01176]|nr:hypothetical protein OG199_01370 [Streptomyces sp. NBC_01176]